MPISATVGESGLRMFVTQTVMPLYPPEDVKNGKSGVAVAHVEVSEDGRVAKLNITEAPTKAISEEVTRAVSLWRFEKTFVRGQPARMIGDLTFYFVIRGREGRVLNPAETGYVGRWPQKGSH
jgi:TonB family protein